MLFRRLAYVGISSAALVLVACVGDTPVVQVPDAGNEASTGNDAAADSSLPVDSSTADTGPNDATTSDVVDAAPCINTASVGSTITLPTTGNLFLTPNSDPMTSGDYKLTSAYYNCQSCQMKSASAVGGLKITVTGPNVTIERHVDVQVSGDPLVSVVDRLNGTFDQINNTLKLTRECPGSAVANDWGAIFKASNKTLEIQFPNDLQTKTTTNGVGIPTYVFTKP